MHVVHASTVHTPHDVRAILKECRSLVEDGFRVSAVLPGESPRPVEDWARQIEWCLVQPPANRMDRFTRVRRAVVEAVLRLRADIVHVHDGILLPDFSRIEGGGAQLVYDMHDLTPSTLRTKTWVPRGTRLVSAYLWKWAEYYFLKKRAVVFADESYSRRYPWVGDSVVIRNFVRRMPEIVKERGNAEQPTVAYLGAVTRGRGLDLTLDALRMLKGDGSDVAWECVGPIDGDARRRLETWRRRHATVPIRAHGALPHPQALALVARAHVGLAVLQAHPNYVESYPTKLFEYMALGLPVIASDFPLYREVVEGHGCGICVDPRSPRELADAIEYLVSRPEEAEQMGARGRQAARQHYQWEDEFPKLVEFYRRILVG